jgi:hypothetical protein
VLVLETVLEATLEVVLVDEDDGLVVVLVLLPVELDVMVMVMVVDVYEVILAVVYVVPVEEEM